MQHSGAGGHATSGSCVDLTAQQAVRDLHVGRDALLQVSRRTRRFLARELLAPFDHATQANDGRLTDVIAQRLHLANVCSNPGHSSTTANSASGVSSVSR